MIYFTYIFFALSAILLVIQFLKNKEKYKKPTKKELKEASKYE